MHSQSHMRMHDRTHMHPEADNTEFTYTCTEGISIVKHNDVLRQFPLVGDFVKTSPIMTKKVQGNKMINSMINLVFSAS